MTAVAEFAGTVKNFYRETAVDQLLILAWFIETHQKKTNFDAVHLRQCFKEAGLDAPDMSVYLPRLAAKKPPQVIKDRSSYRLASGTRRALDARLGADHVKIAVVSTLTNLPNQIPNLEEREFLNEALNCYKVKAFRACIVMTWNLTYSHLAHWIFSDSDRVVNLNIGLNSKFPKKNLMIKERSDLDLLKEFEFIDALRASNLIEKNTHQILKDKLGRRNMAAHPSRVQINQHQADDMITDLIMNVVLKLEF
ncbi:hypothetical protein [Roseomonas haemaphysalidis]|uniref:DUF4145 domain-containing protein n=1 Tax=Roseomonas haemaphysalidis TaxID=2768162 RepID=A0ABS3KV49_9PROT|nr:hypothetical protein [Roseomonas haemaphysalidis]MBO1081360.1 hypothetical protein [Roseomonas haemaphysalidis]